MKNIIHKKAMVFGIIVILFCSTFFPGISSKNINPICDEILIDESSEIKEGLAALTFNTFNENGKKEKKIELPLSKAKYIFNLFEKLRNMTISHPNSQETLDLENRFIELIEEYGLIPQGMSTSDIQPLINPHGNPDNPKSRGSTGFLSLIFEILFSNRFNHLRLLGPLDYPSDWSIVCNVAGAGYGIPLPLFILPRPRFITVWGATSATTAVGSLLMPKSFIARGNQQGICLGFVGVGITIAFFGFMGYGMLGYSLYTAIRAQEIERYNNEPTITNENPPSGSTNVPTSLSELSFRLTDGDGDLMSYSVTTSPYIGSGSGSNKVNGVYSVPVSGLEYDTRYSWHVSVDDGYDIVDKTFSFYTEEGPPFDPFKDGWQYRKMVTIDHTRVDGDLTSYPVLISTVDVDLRDKAQNDGDDILFMDGPGVANKLYHEIEYYEDSNGELIAWVNIPSLSDSVDTVLYMYYGNPSCINKQSPERVWDSNYVMVQHMKNYPDNLHTQDSTFYDNDGNKKGYNQPEEVNSKIGYGQDFGTGEYIDIPYSSWYPELGGMSSLTIEAWVKPDTTSSNYHNVISAYRPVNMYYLSFGHWERDEWFAKFCGSKCQAVLSGPSNPPTGVWYYVVCSLDGTKLKSYLDGDFITESDWKSGDINSGNQVIRLGAENSNYGEYLDGTIAEIRISNVARSSEWISTEYDNQNDPASFSSVGPEESAP